MKNFSLKTKENYPHNSKTKSIGKYVFIVLCAFLVLFGAKKILGNISASVSMPLYSVREYIQSSSDAVPVFIRDRLTLLNRIRELEERISLEKSRDATIAHLTQENTELRELGGASETPRIVAGVIARPPHTPYDTIIIDQGSDGGIIPFAPVYQRGGTAIGYVREVYPDTALVVLFSSPGVETTVFVFGPNLFTTAYGEGGGIIRLTIPQGINVEKGNVVILPSLDTGVVGSIHDISSSPTEPEQKAYVSPLLSLQSIRLVSVGTTPVRPVLFDEAMEIVREEEKRLFKVDVPPDVLMQMSTSTAETPSGDIGTSTGATSTPE